VLIVGGGAFIIGGIFLLAMLMAIPNLKTAINGWGPAQIIERTSPSLLGDHLPRRRVGGDPGVLHEHHDRDHPSLLRHGARQPPARV
jgi:hypothetical protein